MLRVLDCVSHQHDLRLVLLAALICCIACYTAINMLWRCDSHPGLIGSIWLVGAAFVFGCGVWTTHFVAMLAYQAGLAIGYEVTRTALSIAIAWTGALIAFWLFRREPRHSIKTVVAGLLLGGSIWAMHFIGVAAMRFQGLILFDTTYVVAALVLGMALACRAFMSAGALKRPLARISAAVWLVGAIVALHFTGMAAVTIVPLARDPAISMVLTSATLSTVVVAVSAMILILSLFGSLVDQHLAWRSAREESKLRHLAHHDALTGLPNRLECGARLAEMLETLTEGADGVAVLCLDLDRFKQVNDLLGHAAGDQLLIQVAVRLQSLVRTTDLVARISGDEFLVALPPPINAGSAADLAKRLVAALAEPFMLAGQQIAIGASVGIALSPLDGVSVADLLRNADTALYQAKNDGRGVFRFFEASMNERLRHRQALEQELRHAISAGQLELHYQPLIDMQTRNVIGFEALVRWNHPTRGLIPPDRFITLAEETGLILPLGQWVLETACTEAASWDLPLKIAVNVSPVQFQQTDLADLVAATLARSGLPAHRLELEITESVLIRHADQALEILNTIKATGVSLSLDDFGTGYSSLSYLRRYPFSKLKIDRSFVHALGQDKEAAVITRAIVALAHSLRLQVTAEGIETEDQFDFLASEACNQGQGYLLGKPMAAANIARLRVQSDARPSEDKRNEKRRADAVSLIR
jgi:diguanylate cyclase (GGDEF)-like protein